ncbi:hypothetical protein T439DRAFT_134454 [Meredithblackwellia eburnea MCA 4105]
MFFFPSPSRPHVHILFLCFFSFYLLVYIDDLPRVTQDELRVLFLFVYVFLWSDLAFKFASGFDASSTGAGKPNITPSSLIHTRKRFT